MKYILMNIFLQIGTDKYLNAYEQTLKNEVGQNMKIYEFLITYVISFQIK